MDSGSELKRTVIRMPKEPPAEDPTEPLHAPEPTKTREPRAAADVWLAVATLGSILAAFGPLLPWWKVKTLQFGVQVSTVVGTGVWPGIISFAGGITALVACTYLYAKPDRRATLGLLVLGAGTVAAATSVLAAANSEHLVVTTLNVESQIGILLSLAGGSVAAIGGYLLTREGSSI